MYVCVCLLVFVFFCFFLVKLVSFWFFALFSLFFAFFRFFFLFFRFFVFLMFFVRFWLPFFLLFVLRGGAWCSTYTLIWTRWTSRNLAILCFPHYETVGNCREVDEQKLAIHMCFRYYTLFLGSSTAVSHLDKCPSRNLAAAADVLFPRLRQPFLLGVFDRSVRTEIWQLQLICFRDYESPIFGRVQQISHLETSVRAEIWPLQLICVQNYESRTFRQNVDNKFLVKPKTMFFFWFNRKKVVKPRV